MGLRLQYKAFNTALQSLYRDNTLTLAGKKQPPAFDSDIFKTAAEHIYKAGGFDPSLITDPKVRAVITETFRILETGISSSLSHEMPDEVRHALENNAFVFSGFKTYHSLREVGLSLTTDTGDIKPYNEFLNEVQVIDRTYNRNYLYAEYNHAVASSQMAERWQRFERDGDRYDLQYRTAGDDKVREDHAILHGTTLPPSDPFWEKYLPPNGWNCRCTTVQVLRGKYPQSDPALAMLRGNNCTEGNKQQMFRYNPGKTLELFPPKHPYYKVGEQAKQSIEAATKEIKTGQDVVDFINESTVAKEWFERGFSELTTTTKRNLNGRTDMNGRIELKPQRLKLVLSGLDKARKNKDISFEEADALATFWHEVTHNRSKQGNVYRTSLQTDIMELANEFVARNTLPEFYQGIGGKMQYPEFIENRASTGYNPWVLHYQQLIKELGCDKGKVLSHVRHHLFNEKYNDQMTGLVEALEKAGAKKENGKKLKRSELNKLVRSCLYENEKFQNDLKSLIMQ